MTLATVRRLAADILNVGQNKIWISPDGLKDAEGALTRSDVKSLIDKRIVLKLKPCGRASTRRTGRTGHGRRRGTPVDAKVVWMVKVRAQRAFLRMLTKSGALQKDSKRMIYGKIKSGIFRNKRAMLLYLKENKFVAADYEPPKKEYIPKTKTSPKPKKSVGSEEMEQAKSAHPQQEKGEKK